MKCVEWTDAGTGEIHLSLTAEHARDLLDGIKANLIDTAELVEELWRGMGWVHLGYDSWAALVEAEIRPLQPRLDREERKALVADLASKGMSTRAIGAAVGASVGTVHSDLAAGVQNRTPEPDAPSPAPVTGLDGKTYPARPKPADDEKNQWDADTKRLLKAVEHWRTALYAFKQLGIEIPASAERAINRSIDTWDQSQRKTADNA